MRLDLYLKSTRLILRRSLAKEFTKAGLIKVNGVKAKSGREMKVGDEIEIKRHNRLTRVKVTEVPQKKQVSKNNAANLYEIISEEILDDEMPFEISLGTE
ncbi:MAG: RNA-binding S4 domain-containing protein [Aridibacter sp.]